MNRRLLTLQVAGMFAVIGLCLFVAAGTWQWPAAWAFLLLFLVFVLALVRWLLHHNPSLLVERMTGTGKSDQKAWDLVFTILLNIYFLAWLVAMPLDAVRFGWSHMSPVLQAMGGLGLLGAFYLFFLTFRENAYLSPAVRIQHDRGQRVVSTGPYRLVRHPMYAAGALYLLGTALLLGSWVGVVGGVVIDLGLAWRAVQEERTLNQDLPGYAAYLSQVRWRLVPYLW
ncbi:MAG: methyltransferase family protein [Sulfobacillus sp.]